MLELRAGRARGYELGHLLGVFGYRDRRPRVPRLVRHLLRGQGRVDGRVDRAKAENRDVDHVPLGAGVAGHDHPVAGRNPEIGQGIGQSRRPTEEFHGPEGPGPAWEVVNVMVVSGIVEFVAVEVEDGTIAHWILPGRGDGSVFCST